MSSYAIPKGMTSAQADKFVKQKEAEAPTLMRDFKDQVKQADGIKFTQPRRVAPLLQQMKAQKSGVMGKGSQRVMKKGGSANHYTKGGKINLDACGVSTSGKSNKCPTW